MVSGKTAVRWLRYFTGIVIVVGIAGMCYGLLNRASVPLFMFDVPSWIISASCAYLGLRHYRRIPELEKKINLNGGFSWGNFRKSAKAK